MFISAYILSIIKFLCNLQIACHYIFSATQFVDCMECLFDLISKNVSLVALAELETKCYDAFNCGRRDEALRLLKQVEDPHTVKSNNNFTVLHCAAYHGWLDVVEELINDHQFDPDCKDDDGNTPLSKAKGNGKQSVVDYLETVTGIFF